MIFAKSLLQFIFLPQLLDVDGLNNFTIFVVRIVLMHIGGSCRPTVFSTIHK